MGTIGILVGGLIAAAVSHYWLGLSIVPGLVITIVMAIFVRSGEIN
jgi:hypothetical protein